MAALLEEPAIIRDLLPILKRPEIDAIGSRKSQFSKTTKTDLLRFGQMQEG